ncbi:mucin-2-like [Cloeon dipterum]|uniref:mucin-2-like n=1 Tax=Cloeon dipterum TaxID=197152 RepID=UPI0032202CFC
MEKVTDGGTDWLGDLASALLPPKDPSNDGDCLGLSALGLEGISCDMVSNFVCEVPDPPGMKTTVKATTTKKKLSIRTTTRATSSTSILTTTKTTTLTTLLTTATSAKSTTTTTTTTTITTAATTTTTTTAATTTTATTTTTTTTTTATTTTNPTAMPNTANWKATSNFWTSGTIKGSSAGLWSWCEPSGPAIFTKDLVWETGQPDNKGGNESCIHFRFIFNSTGTILSDRNCANHYSFACKRVKEWTITFLNKKDYVSYGDWYQGCGRMFLNFTKSAASWATARDKCCEIGLTLASMESVGKLNCFSKLIQNGNGDFWLSGTDQGCPSKFRWCSRNRDFVSPEIKWKVGHPKAGLACVYLEVRNGTALLATADCAEQKNPLCEIRKKATPNVAMEMECAEIWDVPLG